MRSVIVDTYSLNGTTIECYEYSNIEGTIIGFRNIGSQSFRSRSTVLSVLNYSLGTLRSATRRHLRRDVKIKKEYIKCYIKCYKCLLNVLRISIFFNNLLNILVV